MAGWFRRRDDDGVALPKEWSKALDQVLQGLSPGHPDLPGEVGSYVRTGEPASCLGRVASCTDAAIALRVGGYYMGRLPDAHRQLYAAMGGVPPEPLLRWARVLETQVKQNAWNQQLADIDGRRTVESLLFAAGHVLRDGEQGLRHTQIEDILELDGSARSAVLVRAFEAPPASYLAGIGEVRKFLVRMSDYDEAVRRHAEEVRAAIGRAKGSTLVLVLEMLSPLSSATRELFAGEIVGLATGTGVRARLAATRLVTGSTAHVAPLRARATAGKPEQRLHALRLLRSLATTDEERAWIQETAAVDRAPSVQALVDGWAGQSPDDEEPEVLPDAGPRPEIDWRVSVTPELRATLTTVWAQANASIDRANDQARRSADAWQAQHGSRPAWASQQPRLQDADLDLLLAQMAHGSPPRADADESKRTGSARPGVRHLRELVPELAGNEQVTLAVLAHLLHYADLLVDHRGALADPAVRFLNTRHAATGRPSLAEVARLYDDMGLDGPRAVLSAYSTSWGAPLGRYWSRDAVAPFVAQHVAIVGASVGAPPDWYTNPLAVYRAIGTLSTIPRALSETLFSAALTGFKTQRTSAQDALTAVPDRDQRVASALSDGKGEVRAEAARWIARARIDSAVPALEKAWGSERQDVVKGYLLDALAALGRPVEAYLDRDRLAMEAERLVAKGLPKDLDWFPWSALPEVHWSDTGDAVPRSTLQSLFTQAVKAKSAEPNALLRRYCSLIREDERRLLGQFVLDVWIAQDLRPVDQDVAQAKAAQQAQWIHQSMQRWPQHFEGDPRLGWSVEQLTAVYLPAEMRQPAGSAIASKGLLAIAAACAGEGAAASAARYLQEWYGMRAAQGKALIAMLAWVDHPSATQLMLSVGSRFRTKSFQEEATRQAQAMAERKGWTLEELADRTIPTGGLDESAVLRLSYGEREFTASLLPDLSLELRNPDGKKIASLPTPRQTDDEAQAKESKKALAAARKEVKAVVKLQGERLYEALCTDREWPFEDWDRYLNRHPLMHLLVQRLVWTAATAGGTDGERRVFRPLDDYTLTDVDDAEVTLAPDARVRLAHGTTLSDDQVAAWREHLTDYEVSPLFQQFGKSGYTLGEADAQRAAIEDFVGCLVESFTLRGRATRLGYTRGAPADGGWFSMYEKRFPTLGITTIVNFSGSPLPEESRTVALGSLTFERRAEGRGSSSMLLDTVPAVLLAEAYDDMRTLAGGATPDPDWEKKVQW